MQLHENDMIRLLKKYEEDKMFPNEEVHRDLRDLIATVRYWKRQAEIYKKRR